MVYWLVVDGSSLTTNHQPINQSTKITRLFNFFTMKKWLLLLPFLSLLLSSCGSPATVGAFYREHKRKEGVRNFSIPGWLIWLGTGLANSVIDDEEARVALRLAKKVKRLQLMIAEDASPISTNDVRSFVSSIHDSGFEDLIYVRDQETNINILVKEHRNKLRHLVVLVNDDSDFVFINMRTNIKVKDISKVIRYFLEKEGWADKKKKKKKKKEEAIPQV